MSKDIPKFKQELIKKLKTISTSKDFILAVGSAAGQTEEDAQKVIDFITRENPTISDVLLYASGIHLRK
ncbi:MAG: hypothetical protein ACOX4I_00380 [Anaerovoracaceae bacterium]|jgi:hypothetical protein